MDNKPEAFTRESGSKDRATPGLVVVWGLLVALAFVSIPGAAYLMRGGLQHGPGTLDERVRTAAIIVAAPATAMLLNNVAKHISQRPRPLAGMNHLTTSFPSGHTATSTAV